MNFSEKKVFIVYAICAALIVSCFLPFYTSLSFTTNFVSGSGSGGLCGGAYIIALSIAYAIVYSVAKPEYIKKSGLGICIAAIYFYANEIIQYLKIDESMRSLIKPAIGFYLVPVLIIVLTVYNLFFDKILKKGDTQGISLS